MKAPAAIFCVCFFGLTLAGPARLPDEIPKCRRKDPLIDVCLRNAIQTSIPIIGKGIPKLGVFPLEPLRITSLNIAQGTGSFSIDLRFRELDIIGLTNMIVDKVTSDLDNYKIEFKIHINPPLILDSEYNIKGNASLFPLTGQGRAHLTLDNVKAAIALRGSEQIKGGRTYMHLENLDLQYETTKLAMNFENLFSANKNLGHNMNDFLNENWQEIHNDIYPAIREALGVAFKEVASRLLSKVPYDDIFLP